MSPVAAQQRTDGQSAHHSFLRQRGVDLAVNLGLLALLYVAYSAIRTVTADEWTAAVANAIDVMSFQRLVGLPSELDLQYRLLNRAGLLKAANIYYAGLHFPATGVFLGWIWFRHRDRFEAVRNTLIVTTLAGLVAHLAYPLAPPRMIPGFVDTAAEFGPNPYDLAISASANQIAAMPSLHVGWALLVAIGTISIPGPRWRFLILAHPVITTGVVIVTANHYWMDAIVGALVVVMACVACKLHWRSPSAGESGDAHRGGELDLVEVGVCPTGER